MARMRLRPQAERAHRRTAARGVEGNVRVQQERNVIPAEVQIALVDLRNPGQLVEILDVAAFRIVNVRAVLAVADAGKILERRALGVVGDLIIELAAHDEIDRLGRVQNFIRLDGHRRSDEGDLHLGVRVLHHLRDLHVHVKSRRGGEQHQQFEILGHARQSAGSKLHAAGRPAPCCLRACPPGSKATPDTSRIRFRAWRASATPRRRQSRRMKADLETEFSSAQRVGSPLPVGRRSPVRRRRSPAW